MLEKIASNNAKNIERPISHYSIVNKNFFQSTSTTFSPTEYRNPYLHPNAIAEEGLIGDRLVGAGLDWVNTGIEAVVKTAVFITKWFTADDLFNKTEVCIELPADTDSEIIAGDCINAENIKSITNSILRATQPSQSKCAININKVDQITNTTFTPPDVLGGFCLSNTKALDFVTIRPRSVAGSTSNNDFIYNIFIDSSKIGTIGINDGMLNDVSTVHFGLLQSSVTETIDLTNTKLSAGGNDLQELRGTNVEFIEVPTTTKGYTFGKNNADQMLLMGRTMLNCDCTPEENNPDLLNCKPVNIGLGNQYQSKTVTIMGNVIFRDETNCVQFDPTDEKQKNEISKFFGDPLSLNLSGVEYDQNLKINTNKTSFIILTTMIAICLLVGAVACIIITCYVLLGRQRRQAEAAPLLVGGAERQLFNI